jgi:hypothetical protein
LPHLPLSDPNDTAVAIENCLFHTYLSQKKDEDGYKRQLSRILNALETPLLVDNGLFAARVSVPPFKYTLVFGINATMRQVLRNDVSPREIAVMSADDMVSAAAAAAAKASRDRELHLASLDSEAVLLGKVVNTHVHTFWSYPQDGD